MPRANQHPQASQVDKFSLCHHATIIKIWEPLQLTQSSTPLVLGVGNSALMSLSILSQEIFQTSPDIVLEESSQALQLSLQSLSRWLTALSSPSTPNLASIGETADTIGKVTTALAQIRQLQWSESRTKTWV